MNRKRVVLYLIFVVYQFSAFIFTYLVDGHLDLLGLLKFIPWFKYITFLGLILISVDVVWFFMDLRANSQQKDELTQENTGLKARIFDLQESEKKASASKQT